MTKSIKVSKFGGSSMANFETMSRSAKIAIRQKSNLIIVSAVYGVTNDLISLYDITRNSDQNFLEKVLYSIKEKHLDIIYALNNHDEVLLKFNSEFDKLEQISKGLLLLKEFNLSVYDQILSFGERISSIIFTGVLHQVSGVAIQHIDSREYIKTDQFYSHATPQTDLIEQKVKTLNFTTPVVAGGFIGSTIDNKTTTLGRGGSDYTAALYAEALSADVLEIWTDVDGIASCDPRLVSNAKRIKDLSYKEASELAYYGAKILHPITIQPVKRKMIPIFIGSSLVDDSLGTWVKENPSDLPKLRAIAVRHDQIMIKLTNKKLLRASRFLSLINNVLEKNKISIDTIQMSETTITLIIPEDNNILKDLNEFSETTVVEDLSLVSFIGNKINQKESIQSDILSLLGDTNIWSINLGASDNSFSVAVESSFMQDIVQKIHSKYL